MGGGGPGAKFSRLLDPSCRDLTSDLPRHVIYLISWGHWYSRYWLVIPRMHEISGFLDVSLLYISQDTCIWIKEVTYM